MCRFKTLMEGVKCGNCPYFDDGMGYYDKDGDQVALCVRFPPPPGGFEHSFHEGKFVNRRITHGPFVTEDMVCGEHPLYNREIPKDK